jgi:hypothetical protein
VFGAKGRDFTEERERSQPQLRRRGPGDGGPEAEEGATGRIVARRVLSPRAVPSLAQAEFGSFTMGTPEKAQRDAGQAVRVGVAGEPRRGAEQPLCVVGAVAVLAPGSVELGVFD